MRHEIAKGRLLLRQHGLSGLRPTIIVLLGGTVVLVGTAMIVLPGPAILVIPLGMAILATEFMWAKRLLKRAERLLTSEAVTEIAINSDESPECSKKTNICTNTMTPTHSDSVPTSTE